MGRGQSLSPLFWLRALMPVMCGRGRLGGRDWRERAGPDQKGFPPIGGI